MRHAVVVASAAVVFVVSRTFFCIFIPISLHLFPSSFFPASRLPRLHVSFGRIAPRPIAHWTEVDESFGSEGGGDGIKRALIIWPASKLDNGKRYVFCVFIAV